MQSDKTILLDVRSTEEFVEGHFEGSINIPLHILEFKLNELDQDAHYITLCRSGARSETAKNIFIRNGWKATNGGPWSTFKLINDDNR